LFGKEDRKYNLYKKKKKIENIKMTDKGMSFPSSMFSFIKLKKKK
jgi:hypothetical protein